jgi:hypothetical protein
MPAEPHYGCPKCGSPKFSATQDVTEYCTETAYCTYTSQEPDTEPEFEVEDTDNRDCYDSGIGDLDETRRCQDCSHEYTEPVFYPAQDSIESIAERSGTTPQAIAYLTPLIDLLPHASIINVHQEAHATVISATPRSITRGPGRWRSWKVSACCRCNAEMDEPRFTTRQAYRTSPGGLTGREKILDPRQLPVLIRASLCRNCQ